MWAAGYLSSEILILPCLDGAELVGGVDAAGRRVQVVPGRVLRVDLRVERLDAGGVQHGVHVRRQGVRSVLHVAWALVCRRRGHGWRERAVLAHPGRDRHLGLLVRGHDVVVDGTALHGSRPAVLPETVNE